MATNPEQSDKIFDAALEQLANYAHRSWSGWMRYLFAHCVVNPNGDLTVPEKWVRRWRRQVDTPYAKLSKREKESDRKEARAIIAVLAQPVIMQPDRPGRRGD
jgi:hypothetical protein